jgi:hypothetical protein
MYRIIGISPYFKFGTKKVTKYRDEWMTSACNTTEDKFREKWVVFDPKKEILVRI